MMTLHYHLSAKEKTCEPAEMVCQTNVCKLMSFKWLNFNYNKLPKWELQDQSFYFCYNVNAINRPIKWELYMYKKAIEIIMFNKTFGLSLK